MTVPPVPLLEQMDQIDRQAQVQGGQGQEKTEEKTGGQGEGQGGGGGEGVGAMNNQAYRERKLQEHQKIIPDLLITMIV